MANIKKLKANGQDIVPITHEQAVLDSNGVTLDSKLNAINNAISRLENNSTPSTPDTPSTPSLEGNIKILTIGNYTITYNETDDTLDFIYNGAIDEPVVPPTTDEEIIPLTWAVGNLSSTDGSEKDQANSLRSSFTAIVSGSTYSFYLDTSFYDPSGVRVYFYDTNKTFISRTDGDILGYTTGVDIPIDIPSNAAYMRFKSNVNGTITINNINSLFTLRKRKIEVNDEIVIPTWNDGKSIAGGTGEIIVNEAAMVTDPIAIDNNYNYTIRYNPTTTNQVRIAFYDSSQGFISRSNYLTSGNEDTLITFPENTAYFRIKFEKVGITVNEANDNIILKKVKKVGGYVTEGLSMYIDATRNSISDITGNHTITNHGVTHTSDNNLNFVASESDYLDTDFTPNLTQWSAELYFYFTETSTSLQTILGWGASGNKMRIGYSGSSGKLGVQSNHDSFYTIDGASDLISPHHLIITMNNGAMTSYLDGVKTVLCASGDVQTSHTNTLKIGTKYDVSGEFTNMNLKMFRFYDGKVLSDEEALQNYNYETNRNSEPGTGGTTQEEVIPLVWAVGNLDSSGAEKPQDNALRSGFVTIEDNYNYSFYLDTSFYDPSGVRVYFYDTNKTYISRTDGNVIGYESGKDISIDIPSNAAYMRFKANSSGTTTVDTIGSLFTLKRKTKANGYVTNGLSLYIDAQDVTTQGSIRDITGKQTIVNHGVSTTLDNGCLNFVASESDYIDGGFKPNLTKWSAEAYFYFTATPTSAETVLGWGASGNRTAIAIWGNNFMIAINGNEEHTIMSTKPTSLTHVILTYDNGKIIAYVNGEKSQIATNANVMSSQAGNLMIGTKYSASGEFGNIHLKSLRFYDNKVLTDEEALQNYNYELRRNSSIIKPTWIDNMKLDSSTGILGANEGNACTDFIPYDNSYVYTLAIDTVGFFRVFYYDSSKAYISNDSIADSFNGTITPPSNTAYMRLKVSKGEVAFADLDNHVIFKKALAFVVKPTWTDGQSISGSTGEAVVNTEAMSTNFIQIDENYNYTISYTNVIEVRIASYDNTKAFISRSEFLTSGSVDSLIEFPANATYFKVKFEKNGIAAEEADNNVILKAVSK